MNSRSRVYAALERRPVDRVPIWMWLHPATTAHLAQLLDIPARLVADALGDDVRQAWVGNNHAMEGIVHEHEGESHTDAWGLHWVKESYFNQIAFSPLAGADEEAMLAYRHPLDAIDDLLANMEPVMARADEYFTGCDLSPCVFELVCRIRGMEGAIMDLAGAPDLARVMLRRAADFSVELAERACGRYDFDWIWTGDDVGGQHGMIMSPRCWREMIRPELERVFEVGRAAGRIIAYHSCGAIRPIIPDLVEMGLDVLNPVQCNCPGMDPVELKREFGADLSFMGGVDTQHLLPEGTEAEVYAATARLVEEMTADGGGYILAASHAVPPETPDANLFAMYAAAGVSREEIFDRAADLRRS